MTSILQVTCDRCSRPVLENRGLLIARCGLVRLHHPTTDLCVDCQADYATWLSTGKPEPAFALAGAGPHQTL